jgi:hypothetical protein
MMRRVPRSNECEALAALADVVQTAGLRADRAAVISLYVALKSKPLTLLVGPQRAGKVAVLRCLGHALTSGESLYAQFMPGHAWWAGQTGNVGLYTQAQTRLNTFKLLTLLDEAHAPENRERVLLGCLTRISPAELLTVFSDTAYQLRHGELMRLGAAHFTEPVPYPHNLLLAGTLDAACAQDLEPPMLSMTNVIEWAGGGTSSEPGRPLPKAARGFGREFLASMVRTEAAARLKLQRTLQQSLAALCPLMALEAALGRRPSQLLSSLRSELLVYLANAFSREGHGLFAERPRENLEAALDWAITTIIIPRVRSGSAGTHDLGPALREACADRWPNAARSLEHWPSVGSSSPALHLFEELGATT